MNFTLLLTTVSTLSFTINFKVSDDSTQDYFIFEGDNQTAHLFRENSTLYLRCTQLDRIAIYKTELTDVDFRFSWLDHIVNGRVMEMLKKDDDFTAMSFEHYVLISPQFVEEDVNLKCTVNPSYEVHGTNYWYIAAIVVVVAIIGRSHPLLRETFSLMFSQLRQEFIQHHGVGGITPMNPMRAEDLVNEEEL